MMDVVHIWYEDRYRFEDIFSSTFAYAHDIKEVTHFMVKL